MLRLWFSSESRLRNFHPGGMSDPSGLSKVYLLQAGWYDVVPLPLQRSSIFVWAASEVLAPSIPVTIP
jgi:hypothetical protein